MKQETGRSVVAVLSGVGAWLVPAWGCPVCLSALAGTMSAFGFGFMAREGVLTPLTSVLLIGSLLALGLNAKRRKCYGAVALGVVAAGFIAGSKFFPAQSWLSHAGLAGLLGATIWNMRVANGPTPCSPEREGGFSRTH